MIEPRQLSGGFAHDLRAMVRCKYFWLWVSLLALTITAPLLAGTRSPLRLPDIITASVLIAATYAIMRNRRHVVLALALLIPAAAMILVAFITSELAFEFVGEALLALFLGYIILIILADVLTTTDVTADTLMGAVCIYLLLGLFFAISFSLVALSIDDAFCVIGEHLMPSEEMVFNRAAFGQTVYFSLVTLTTLGYGDITPAAPIARSLATLEAIFGQIYLTILVARLVGMHISGVVSRPSDAHK